ncbi:MAG TPA: threonine ammonia-lyase, biosynthetic [Candidatus Dormibacteraeota bacterium]|nr:threonine ammonia-lyase, biosynthetic [Candidatus Dormibacteraeota bacterium]
MDVAAEYLGRILRARVSDIAIESPLEPARRLSARLGNAVLIKREGLQPAFSFKIRGAYNKMRLLDAAQRRRGVIAASAGNHAQGVAMAGGALGIDAVIVMPTTTPAIKVDAVRALGGRAVLHGDTFDDAYLHAREIGDAEERVFIHPYDDADVIAGQGTIAAEILRQSHQPIDAVFVPVGGGGLIAGIAAYIKAVSPETRVVGVEPDDSNAMQAALAAGERVALESVSLFADGVAVRQVGAEPFRVARACVDEMVLVNTDEICAAIKDIFEDTRGIAEPAGALGVAGLTRWVERAAARDRVLVAIESGANLNFDRLRYISERTETGAHAEVLLAVRIPEAKGSFRRFCGALGERAITEFNYRFSDPARADIFVGLKVRAGDEDRRALIAALQEQGYPVTDLTDNEVAKSHVRYMVGGRARVADEVLYRFEFPERPGALLRFLNQMGERWNISLFHYRNHGAADGRVLAGMQVAPEQRRALRQFLADLGYPYHEETDNPAYAFYLAG